MRARLKAINDSTHVNAIANVLYTYSSLCEDSKVDKTSFHDRDVEYGRRYAVLEKSTTPDYLMPVKLLNDACYYNAFAPRESICIKMSGGGLR